MVNIIKTAPSKGTPWWCPTCQLWLSGLNVSLLKVHHSCGGTCELRPFQEKAAEDDKIEIDCLREEVKKWMALCEANQSLIERFQHNRDRVNRAILCGQFNFFVECETGEFIDINQPVNMDMCKSIGKVDDGYSHYIVFNGCDVAWLFATKQDRDSEFQRLVSMTSLPVSTYKEMQETSNKIDDYLDKMGRTKLGEKKCQSCCGNGLLSAVSPCFCVY